MKEKQGFFRNHRIAAILVLLCILCAGIGAFLLLDRTQSSEADHARQVLTTLLNAPNETLEQAYETLRTPSVDDSQPEDDGTVSPEDLKPKVENLDETPLREALTALIGDDSTEAFRNSCLSLNEIMSLHYAAILHDFTVELKELSINTTNQSGVQEYEATLLIRQPDGGEQTIHVIGQIQLDPDGKVNAVTLRGRELDRFYQSL